MTTQYHILFPVCEEAVSHYHSLSIEEVIDLLEKAIDHKVCENGSAVASIQVRLGQGIPGIEYPVQIEGPIARKRAELDKKFTAWIRDPALALSRPITERDPIVVTLMELMQ